MPLSLEKTTDNDWNSVRRNFLEIETDWDRGHANRRVLTLAAAAPPYDLGSFDGNAIQGLRITLHGRISWSAGAGNVWIACNGLSGATSHADVTFLYDYTYWDAAAGSRVQSGSNNQGQPGLICMIAGFGTAEMWDMDGMLFTNEGSGNFTDPSTLFHYSSRDDITNGNRVIAGQVACSWLDGPVVNSAKVHISGTNPSFTGHITSEIIP